MKKKIVPLLIFTSLTSAGLCWAPTAMSQQKAEDKIKFRQSGFMFMRWNMGIIKKNVIKAPQRFNREKVIAAARVIESISQSGIQSLFSPGTETGKGWKETRVKKVYFNNPDKVNQYTVDLINEAETLVEVSKNGDIDDIKSQFKTVLNTCKGCHKSYRKK